MKGGNAGGSSVFLPGEEEETRITVMNLKMSNGTKE
jgi:hypothetical protein